MSINSKKHSHAVVVTVFILGLILGGVGVAVIIDLSSSANEDTARNKACASAGYDGVVNKQASKQITVIGEKTYLICTETVKVNGVRLLNETAILYREER